MTGQVSATYTADENSMIYSVAVHPDGTIFAVQLQDRSGDEPDSLIGVESTTGLRKFSVPMEGGPDGPVIIAGDGYAYLPNAYWECNTSGPESEDWHIRLLRVGTNGADDNLVISDFNSGPHVNPCEVPWYPPMGIITNADKGTLLSWAALSGPMIAATQGTSVSLMSGPQIADQKNGEVVMPVLQAQDGSYVGTIGEEYGSKTMVAFDQSGAVRWVVPATRPRSPRPMGA